MKNAKQVCETAAGLVGGDRAKSHGDKTENHRNIATLWNAYLGWRLGEGCLLKPEDVALMMLLLKVARTKTGTFNEDDFVDMAGYAGCAAEIAGLEDAKGKIVAPLEPLVVPEGQSEALAKLQAWARTDAKINLDDFRGPGKPSDSPLGRLRDMAEQQDRDRVLDEREGFH
jgi:hypothetical protein